MLVQCIFCNLKDDTFIYQDQDGTVILDEPICPGHVLVGSRIHAESLNDLLPADAAAVLRLANRVAKSIVLQVGATKVYMVAIGDKDKHFHVHLLPKHEGDPDLGPFIFGDKGWASFFPPDPASDELTRVNESLRRTLREQDCAN